MSGNKTTCRCTGGCGSRWCLGWITWGKPCGMIHGNPHPATGNVQTITAGLCTHCVTADAIRRHRHARRVELLTTGNSHTESLFSLVAGGGIG